LLVELLFLLLSWRLLLNYNIVLYIELVVHIDDVDAHALLTRRTRLLLIRVRLFALVRRVALALGDAR
jgi:hypothetical protein